MSDSWSSSATVATSIALNLARAALYPFSLLFRVVSLWVILIRTLIAIWIPVAVGLSL